MAGRCFTGLLLLLLYLCPALCTHEDSSGEGSEMDDFVDKLNYGVVFSKMGRTTLTPDVWTHVVQIPLPIPYWPEIALNKRCPDDPEIQVLSNHLSKVRNDTLNQLKSYLEDIKELVPETDNPGYKAETGERENVKTHYKNILNVTSNLDIQDIQATERVFNKFGQGHSRLGSQGKLQTENYNDLINALVDMENKIECRHSQTDLNTQSLNVLSVMQDYDMLAEQLLHKVHDLRIAFYQSRRGLLTPEILPVSYIHDLLDDIDTRIQHKYPTYKVLYKDPGYYYTRCTVVVERLKDTLYLGFHIPVTNSPRVFTTYRITSLPVPLNHTTRHSTFLKDLPQYISISADETYIIEVSGSEAEECSTVSWSWCLGKLPQRQVSSPTCASALFYESPKDIKQQCNYRFIYNGTKPGLREVKPGLALLTDMTVFDLAVHCDNTAYKLGVSCMMCVIEVPCACRLWAGPYTMTSSLTECSHSPPHPIVPYYPINLALLHAFLAEDQLKTISGESLYEKPFEFSVPHFHIYHNNLSESINQPTDLSLSEMVKRALNDEVIYTASSDLIISGIWKPQVPNTRPNLILPGVALLFSVFSMGMAVYSYRRYRKLATLVTVIQTAVATEASPVNQRYEYTDTVLPQTANVDISLPMYVILFILVLLSIIAVFLMVCKLYRSRPAHSSVELVVSNGSQCCAITLLKPSVCPHYLKFPTPFDICSVELAGDSLWPFLLIDYKGVPAMVSSLTQVTTHLPFILPLGYLQAYRLRHVLKTCHSLQLQFRHNGLAIVPQMPAEVNDSNTSI